MYTLEADPNFLTKSYRKSKRKSIKLGKSSAFHIYVSPVIDLFHFIQNVQQSNKYFLKIIYLFLRVYILQIIYYSFDYIFIPKSIYSFDYIFIPQCIYSLHYIYIPQSIYSLDYIFILKNIYSLDYCIFIHKSIYC